MGISQFLMQCLQGARPYYGPMYPFSKYRCKGVALAKHRNTTETLNDGRYSCIGVVFHRGSDLATEDELSRFLDELIDYCNNHKYSREEGLTKGQHFIRYQRHPVKWDITRNPPQKLGDVVALNDAIGFLEEELGREIFNPNAFSDYQDIIKDYFNPPYNEKLHNAFGFPVNH